MTFSRNFVIARFNEDIRWVDKINFKELDNVLIYNKGTLLDSKYMIKNLENIGREAHTYISYIIDNYDYLPDFSIFLQGNPFDHLVYKIEELNNIEFKKFTPLNKIIESELSGQPHHGGLDIDLNFFNKYFFNKPNSCLFTPGAQFVVSKESILLRSIHFYKSLLLEFYRDDLPDLIFNKNKYPWIIERCWSYIFDENYKSKL